MLNRRDKVVMSFWGYVAGDDLSMILIKPGNAIGRANELIFDRQKYLSVDRQNRAS